MAEVGKVYQSKKNKKILVTVVEENEKFKTCIVEYADGTTRNMTVTTLHNKAFWISV